MERFWRMVWENKMHTIVMVTRCEEAGKVVLEQVNNFYISRPEAMVSFKELTMHCMYIHTESTMH